MLVMRRLEVFKEEEEDFSLEEGSFSTLRTQRAICNRLDGELGWDMLQGLGVGINPRLHSKRHSTTWT